MRHDKTAETECRPHGGRGMTVNRRTLGMVLFGTALAMCSLVVNPGPTAAVEVGEPAPGFTLPSTTGAGISLSDFKGKKFVFLEFYAADFSPACAANLSARKANHKSFEDLGVQVLGVSSNTTFSQQTFAESLKLPYPLLSDFPDRKVIRAYGVLNEKAMISIRTFFLIDRQGVIRKKWIIENPVTTVVYSDTLLPDIQAIVGRP
jgi:peroxiredoxin